MDSRCESFTGRVLQQRRKPLNKANLLALGADTLADLLLEAVKGDAARQRRVRLALAAGQGPEQVAADLRKRFAAIRRGKSFIARQSQKKLGREAERKVGAMDSSSKRSLVSTYSYR